jgi:ATP-dependent RNA/DNA helicase IGHMBP2
MKKSIDELARLKELLTIEREEEQKQFQLLVATQPLTRRRETGVCWYPLIVTEQGYALGEHAYVIVERTRELNKPHQFKAGTVVQLFNLQEGNENDKEPGVVHFVNKNRLKVIFYSKDLPEWLTDGKIGLDLLFDERTFREMENAVNETMRATGNRLADLRDTLLGNRQAEWQPESEVNLPTLGILNESQREAVRQVLAAKDVAIIHGPPGTGKTTTVVQAIKALTEQRRTKTVLVCAPSNSATDLLTERLANQGLYVTRIGNVSRVDESLLSHTLDAQIANHPDSKHIKRVRIEAAQARREANRYRRNFDANDRNDRRSLQQEAKELAAWARELEDKLVEGILSNSQVITCTLAGAASSLLRDRRFDTVVIDEAAQALEGATWIPIRLASRVVLAGDPLQLPPTVKSIDAQRAGLSITLLEKCIERFKPHTIALLKTQYRMNETIMGFSNQYFYKNELNADSTVANQTLPLMGRKAMLFIDTAGCGFEETTNPEQRSKFNPDEFGILREHLYQLLNAYGDLPKPTIGIISPYKEQVNYITKAIAEDEDLQHLKHLTVNTIDGFQGQERDVIYISLVRSNENGEIGFLSDARRMNVALTRAKSKLIVIGDSATLGNHSFYSQFLEYCESVEAYHSAWEWMA